MTKAVLAALAVGLVLAPAARAAEPHFHPCRDAAKGARCGYVNVPLDRAAPAAQDPDPVRALPPPRPLAPGARHDGQRRGRAGLLDDRQPQLLPRPEPAADGPARPAARRPARHRPVRCARLPGLPPHGQGLPAASRPLRAPARPARRPLQHPRIGRRCRRRARRARDPHDRPLRRLVRHLLRAGVRGQPPRPPALARARRRLSAARHRSRVQRSRRGSPPRPAARVRAPPELRAAWGGPGGGARRASSPGSARVR